MLQDRPLTLLNAAAANTTSPALDTGLMGSKAFVIVTSGFTGSLDLKGSWNGAVSFQNLRYKKQGTAQDQGTATLVFAADTNTYVYLCDEWCPKVQAVVEGRKPRRVIPVPPKLVNVVV